MKKLLRYLKDYKKESVLAPLFKLLEALFDLLVPLLMADIIDTGIAQNDIGYIARMCLLLVGLGLVGLACSITAQYFAARAAVGFTAKMKSALFAHIQNLSFTEMDTIGTDTLITRMTSDANLVQNGINMTLRLFLRSPFIVFGAMVMAFFIDVKAALVFVVAIPLLSVVVFGIMAWTMPMYKKVQGNLDRVLTVTRENLTGVRVLRAFHMEENEKRRFKDSNEELTAMQKLVGRISALTNPLTYVIVNGALIVLIWVGGLRVEVGDLTQGQVVALINYMSQILVELIKLANLIVTISKAIACGNRIQSVFEMEPGLSKLPDGADRMSQPVRAAYSAETGSHTAGDSTGAGKGGKGAQQPRVPVVAFRHVGLTYQNAGAPSLTNIDFSAYPGQTIGVIGGTGSGKTSLVNLIPRFYDATEGCVEIDGRNVRDYSLGELRDKVGYVQQKAVLFQGSIRDNLRWGRENATDEELWEALETAQAKDFILEKEGQLDAKVAQGGRNFSGGQRQRLAIARALVRSPRILILDDSTSALDYVTDARLRRALGEKKGDQVVFIVSQRTSSILKADQILVLEEGSLVGIGTHEELLGQCAAYQEIYYSQYEKEA